MEFADFDPLWSLEQAKAAGDDGPESPYQRWAAWALISEAFRSSFEDGNSESILMALRTCAKHKLPMPDWLAAAYMSRLSDWTMLRVKTLDEAFKVERPKGFHLKATHNKKNLEMNIPSVVMRLKREGLSTDEYLFERAGEILGVKTSKAREAYYDSFYYKKIIVKPGKRPPKKKTKQSSKKT